MKKQIVLRQLFDARIVAVIRSKDRETALRSVRACIEGGIRAVEITYTVPDASGIIRLDNPAACLMRDVPLKDVPLETAFPCMMDSFTRSMRDCTEIQGEIRKVRFGVDGGIVYGRRGAGCRAFRGFRHMIGC